MIVLIEYVCCYYYSSLFLMTNALISMVSLSQETIVLIVESILAVNNILLNLHYYIKEKVKLFYAVVLDFKIYNLAFFEMLLVCEIVDQVLLAGDNITYLVVDSNYYCKLVYSTAQSYEQKKNSFLIHC